MSAHNVNPLSMGQIEADSLGLTVDVPKWIQQKRFVISGWEAEGRYNLHFVVRLDTLQKCYQELKDWYERLKSIKTVW